MNKYDIAAYIWPSYTGDEPRSRIFWPDGIGEWQTVMAAESKFKGHSWPRKPLWGYCNEADKYVMEMQINAATDHGVNVFIYDWYWYDDRPFLENCLNDGFLKASNNNKMKFYIMWANHDANHLWDKRNSSDFGNTVVWKGAVDEVQFNIICDRMIEKYFSHSSYYKIENKPVFMIYDVQNFITGLGGKDKARAALDLFRNKCVKAGFPGLHLQFAMWGEQSFNLSGVDGGEKANTAETIECLGFDSMTNYQFCHFTNINRDYNSIINDVEKEWHKMSNNYNIPYFPHVSIGWDNNPRYKTFIDAISTDNTPENFEKALVKAKILSDSLKNPAPLITINSWNEWTETSYLLPDNVYGYGYLEAIKKVFK